MKLGRVRLQAASRDWCRADRQYYAEWVVLRGLQIDTFTKHSAVSLDFGVPNDSSTKTKRRSIGDLPDSSAYWANYVLHAGIKFDWAYVPDESAAYRRRFGGSL